VGADKNNFAIAYRKLRGSGLVDCSFQKYYPEAKLYIPVDFMGGQS